METTVTDVYDGLNAATLSNPVGMVAKYMSPNGVTVVAYKVAFSELFVNRGLGSSATMRRTKGLSLGITVIEGEDRGVPVLDFNATVGTGPTF